MSSGKKTDQTSHADRLAAESNISIDQKLIEEGTAQLNNEIEVLETWLSELDGSDDSNPELVATRKSYSDMLQSRKEMLSTLAKQSRLRAVAD
ncbi:MAG: hypothetical protein OXE78_14940 [Gammaproteobacteria bacterium]|nr:hypothetical protein [Gammaproteobacteria bacterium]MCY4358446.1 hypothetical protein [Gammaproteobacteria bacterium]